MVVLNPIAGTSVLQPRLWALLASLLIVLLMGAPSPAAAQNLLRNGNFSLGAADKPASWISDLWARNIGTEFRWEAPGQGLGHVVIQSQRPNDARWTQSARVKARTWYHLSGWVRGINISAAGMGANLSIMRGFDNAGGLHGEDTGWRNVSMYFRTNPGEELVTVACRLGGYGQESSGEVQCTGIDLSEVGGPPANATHIYGDRNPTRDASGIPASMAILLLLALAIGRFGWPTADIPKRELWLFALILSLVLGAKILIAPLYSYKVDLGTYAAWASRLAQLGPANFYASGYFADYPPGYMYALWGVGYAVKTLGVAWSSATAIIFLKLPALLADLAIAWLTFVRLRPGGKRLAWGAALAFALNPALILNSAVWGQTDAILSLFLLLAFLAQGKRQFELSWALLGLAILTKPQALLVAPLFVFWPWGWWRGGRFLTTALSVLLTTFFVADPFRAGRPWSWLIELYTSTAGNYAETSVNAMNMAAVLFGMRGQDSVLHAGLPAQAWGFIIGLGVGLGFLITYLRARDRVTYTQLLAASTLVAFVCLTRMHERYLYPFFVFAGLLGVSGRNGLLYWTLSGLFLTNELVVFLEQAQATAGPVWLWQSVGVLTTFGMLGWLALARNTAKGTFEPPGAAVLEIDDQQWEQARQQETALLPPDSPNPPDPARKSRPVWSIPEVASLGLLMMVGACLRFWNLGEPAEIVFDETYFVEQARQYLSGVDFMDPHPPFAKWMIASGITIFGDNPFGWRVMNAIAGTVLIGLMYLLGRELFRQRFAAFVAAFCITFDGLLLVDSRIAVIDIHYITWAIGAYILTLRLVADRDFRNLRRLLTIGAVLGISVGAKLYIPFFSFLLVLAIIGWVGWQEAQRRQIHPVRYLLLPINVVGWTAFGFYALTFAGDYFWGWWHSPIDFVRYIFIDVPGYQAAVAEATHPYSSKWYTWPLQLKPIWYFWRDASQEQGTVVGIWGLGNPIIWWASVPALLLALFHTFKYRSFVSGFIVAGWLLHILPWVGIGRTLFLYHYLPSLLFGFLALAWMVDRLSRDVGSRAERSFSGAILIATLIPFAGEAAGMWGWLGVIGLLVGYQASVVSRRVNPVRLGQVVAIGFLVAAIGVSVYLLPIWLGTPITKSAWEARMWISKVGTMGWL
jgi:Gpi18-like mannosyltransferase/4-amino-4-deoxy-L-arabinose transferase-like glycosyltransferase